MSNDLLFSVMPREGTVPIKQEQLRVERPIKEEKAKQVRDDEDNLEARERDAREKDKRQKAAFKAKVEKAKTEQAATDTPDDQKDDDDNHIVDVYI